MTELEIQEYITEFKNKLGGKQDYFPTASFLKVSGWLETEWQLRMPFDTAARDKEYDAVLLLMLSGDEEAIDIGKRLGGIMLCHERDDEHRLALLGLIKEACIKLYKLRNNKDACERIAKLQEKYNASI